MTVSGFAEDRPANPAFFLPNTRGTWKPSPWGEGLGEGGREHFPAKQPASPKGGAEDAGSPNTARGPVASGCREEFCARLIAALGTGVYGGAKENGHIISLRRGRVWQSILMTGQNATE